MKTHSRLIKYNMRRYVLKAMVIATLAVSFTLTGCGGSSSGEGDEGGVIGTGIILRGTASENRAFASLEVEFKAKSGEKSSTQLASSGRYLLEEAKGTSPHLVRTNLGNNEYRYGIAFEGTNANINTYSDVLVRSWFARNGSSVDSVFQSTSAITSLPTKAQYTKDAAVLVAWADLVLDAYQVSGDELFFGSFDANGRAEDGYLNSNPVVITDNNLNLIFTDLETNTQSITRSTLMLDQDFSALDTQPPSAPDSLRAIGSASNEIVLIWNPSQDNIGVVGYQIFRDDQLIDTTPYPVYTDTALVNGSTHEYSITAFDASGNLSPRTLAVEGVTLSAPDNTAPPAPSTLMLSAFGNRVDLIWGQTDIADVASFAIYRGTDINNLERLTGVTSTFITDVNVQSGTQYCYQVIAIDASSNESTPSNIECGTTTGSVVTTTEDQGGSSTSVFAGLSIPDIDSLDCSTELTTTFIRVDTELTDICYIVNEDIRITSPARLTLNEGTVLLFASGTKIIANEGSELVSQGSKERPVVLSAQNATPGSWDGVVYSYSNSTANTLTNTVVQYAGGSGEAALRVVATSSSHSTASIINSLIWKNAGLGLDFEDSGATINSLSDSVITKNDMPALIEIEQLASIDQSNDFSGNTSDIIQIPLKVSEPDNNLIIPDLGVPYSAGIIDIRSVAITIDEGVTILFRSGSRFVVNQLTVSGTAANPILLSAEIESPGQWTGLSLVSGSIIDLKHVTIAYGGVERFNHSANLFMPADSRASLSNVTLKQSSEYGFKLYGNNVEFTKFENVTVTENAIAGYVDNESVFSLQSGSNLTGNTDDVIEVGSGQLHGQDAVWPNTGIPYRVLGGINISDATLTIDPGVTILFDSNAGISASTRTSYLRMSGTEDEPILLTASIQVPGYWDGLGYFSNNVLNILEHVTIEYAGGTADQSNGAVELSCSGTTPTSLTVSNTTIANSGSWGINLDENGCTLNIGQNVQFLSNALGDIK